MKYLLTFTLLSLSLLVSPMRAAEKTVALAGDQTANETSLRQSLADSQLNFDELFKGAGSAETLTYASTLPLDFYKPAFKVAVLTGGVTFASANLVAGKTVSVQITGGGSSRTLAFPAGWVFVGAAAPTALASGKTGLLVLRSFGTADANVVAWYAVQP